MFVDVIFATAYDSWKSEYTKSIEFLENTKYSNIRKTIFKEKMSVNDFNRIFYNSECTDPETILEMYEKGTSAEKNEIKALHKRWHKAIRTHIPCFSDGLKDYLLELLLANEIVLLDNKEDAAGSLSEENFMTMELLKKGGAKLLQAFAKANTDVIPYRSLNGYKLEVIKRFLEGGTKKQYTISKHTVWHNNKLYLPYNRQRLALILEMVNVTKNKGFTILVNGLIDTDDSELIECALERGIIRQEDIPELIEFAKRIEKKNAISELLIALA